MALEGTVTYTITISVGFRVVVAVLVVVTRAGSEGISGGTAWEDDGGGVEDEAIVLSKNVGL
jgi:hypothetical protein